MTQHLRKLISGMVVSAFLIGVFTIQTNAQELTKLWERSDRTGADEGLPSWFTTSMIRGIAEHDGKIYIPDRNATVIRALDAATGADVTFDTPFDLTGVSGGTYDLNDLKISEDGVIFLGNLTVDATTSDFKLYWWTSEGGTFDGSLSLSGVTGRLGDHFSVVGSLNDNSIEIWLSDATQANDPGTVYVLTTDDNGATWATETISLSGTNQIIGSGSAVVPFEAGRESDFYIASNTTAPARYDKDGVFIAGSAFSSASRNGFSLFTADGVDYAAIYSFRADGAGAGNRVGRVIVYDVSDATAPTIAYTTDLIGDDGDYFSSIYGDVAVWVNDDGTFSFTASDGVNGFVAYTNAEQLYIDEPTDKIFFSEYIEGSSNNKALEIYNATDSTVTLANYQIAQSSNGGNWQYYNGFAEGATIGAGEVYVMITDQVFADLFAAEDADEVLSYPSPIHHTGDDARAIIHINPVTNDTTWIDMFGGPNFKPENKGFEVAGVADAAAEHTLIRKPSVTQGNPIPFDSFGTNYDDSEWIVKDQNYFGNLGKVSEDQGPLAGDFFIPQRSTLENKDEQGFISLDQALYYLHREGATDAVNFFITRNLSEDKIIKIDRSDLTETTPLTIKPAPGVTPTISLNGGGADAIWVEKTDYVTFDGSNTADGTTRDMTITSSDDAMVNLFWTNATVNTTIKNLILTYTGSDPKTAIAPNESGTVGTRGWLIENNQIGTENGDFATGIGLWGQGSGVFNLEDAKVIGNDVFVTRRGLTTYFANNTDIIGNTISIVNPSENLAWNAAIYLAVNMGTTNIIGNTIHGLQVNRSDTPNYAAGILFNASLGEVNIFNNIINAEDFKNNGAAAGNQVFGIGINNAAGSSVNKVYHNTIRIGDNAETGNQAAFGLITVASTAQTWDLKNNILVNEKDAENSVIYRLPAIDDINGVVESDYNNFYLSGASSNYTSYNDDRTDLETWQTETGQDANTTTAEVTFVSNEDLRLGGLSIGDGELAGIHLASVATDIDGTPRNIIAPYKGAFEGNIPLAETTLNTFNLLSPENGAALNLQGDPLTDFAFTWESAGAEGDVTYTFLLDTETGDFSNPVFTEDGLSTATLLTTYGDLDDILEGLGYDPGEMAKLQWTVSATDGTNEIKANEAFAIDITRMVSDAAEETTQPFSYSLEQNYPNPFNPTSNIRFTLPLADNVRLDVFNINGQLVKTLVNGRMNAGEHTVQFDASNLASGVYIYRIISGNFVMSKKMTLIK